MSEALAKALHDLFHGVWHVDQPTNMAGSVLALPEVAALIADAERVQRVRELAEALDSDAAAEASLPDGAAFAAALTDAAIRLRRVLDGDQ